MADDLGKTSWPSEPHPGPPAALSRSEVVTLARCGPWQGFGSERGFSRYAQRPLRSAFPSLPRREPVPRQVRQHHPPLVALSLPLVRLLAAQRGAEEALESAGVPPRDAKRRGARGLPDLAAMGWRNRLGGDEGFHGLRAVHPWGRLTGFGCGPARTQDPPLAETCGALRRQPPPALASGGAPAWGPSVVAKGCEGHALPQTWGRAYGAPVLCPPKRHSRRPWPKGLRRWLAGVGQSVETVYEQLWQPCRLERERPHDLSGLQGR